MRKESVIWSLSFLVIFVMFTISSYGQSQQELELARQYAKTNGYSISDIEQFSSPQSKTATPNAKSIDRNAFNNVNGQGKLGTDGGLGLNPGDSYRTQDGKGYYYQGMGYDPNFQKELEYYNYLYKKYNALDSLAVYGHNIFKSVDLNFVPNYNIPTPKNYRLSAGDEVIVNVWGDVITNITETISPEGYIVVPDLGPVYLAGQSVEGAQATLRAALSQIYSQVSDSSSNTQVKLSLGSTRSVTVNVVGDVERPGSYTLPSLSTLATAMYMSGGPTDIGSVRNINLYRNNKLVVTFDVYEFLTKGIDSNNIRLEDNDIISVAPYHGIVSVTGGVKRPMRYETKADETLANILGYAGGFSHSAFTGSVVVDRLSASDDATGASARTFIVESKDFDNFKLLGGDSIIINQNLSRFVNRANISGAVWREGSYAIGDNENQASDLYELFELAGGLRDDAYLKRGYILRYGKNRVREQISFSPADVLLKSSKVAIMPDDSVRVVTIDEVTTRPTVLVLGEVNAPMEYSHRNNMTLGDLIIMAGGLTDGATLSKIEVARRKNEAAEQVESDKTSIVMDIDLLKNPADAELVLMPYDIVFVRKSINYTPQMSVSINGKVLYPGTYVIESNTVRLSEVVAKAGGLSRDAYGQGASLTRIVEEESLDAIEMTQEINQELGEVENMAVKESQAIVADMEEKLGKVVIDLVKVMENPGSIYDLVLKEGDEINIPQFDNTVRIAGAVMKTNSVVYDDKQSVSDYISLAGGYKKRAMKKRTYIVHMNGMIAKRGDKNFTVTPGSTIVVPQKPEREGNTTSSIAAVASISTVLVALLSVIF